MFLNTYQEGFFEATALTDPKNLFEGTGKGMRRKPFKKWVKEAINMADFAGVKTFCFIHFRACNYKS